MNPDLRVSALAIRGFRNLTALDLELSPGITVISGDNGQGKTSILEAIYFAVTTKSFRTENAVDLCQTEVESGSVRVTVDDGGILRQQRATFQRRGKGLLRSFWLDEKRCRTHADFALKTPAVVFQPGDLELVSGPSAGRRTLLDRIALFTSPSTFQARQHYQKAQRERQRLLDRGGPRAPGLDPYEQLMARHGAELEMARAEAATTLVEQLAEVFTQLADPSLVLESRFVPGGPMTAEALLAALRQSRGEDHRRGAARVGPHRDELELLLEGRLARKGASQGQQRILALALKLSEVECLARVRGGRPIILLDDVSSELDSTRTGTVKHFLSLSNSQILVTTTRPEIFEKEPIWGGRERLDLQIEKGQIRAPGSA